MGNGMKTVGICIDRWKLPVFSRRLGASGFTWEGGSGPTDDTMMLIVPCVDPEKLRLIVQAAARECAAAGPPRGDLGG